MKTQFYTIITICFLVLAAIDVYGQDKKTVKPIFNSKQEEYNYYCTEENRLSKECQELNKQAETEKQIEQTVSKGVERLENELKNSDSEFGQNYRRSQIAYDPNVTIEQLMQASGLESGKDYYIEMKGLNKEIVLTSYSGFSAVSKDASNAIEYFNNNVDTAKKAYKECTDLLKEFTPSKTNEYNEKNKKYNEYKDQLYKSLDNAKEDLNTLLRSTKEDKETQDKLKIMIGQIDKARTTLYETPDKLEMLKDFGDLKENFLKDCKVCGQ